MPRRDSADREDRMRTCPHCQGRGQVYSAQIGADVLCPLCSGEGRVSPSAWQRYTDRIAAATSGRRAPSATTS